MKYTRKLIEVEIRLGFLYIPSKGQKVLPNENTTLQVSFDGKTKTLSYNAAYNRIFGLTFWYRKNKLGVGSILEVSIEDEKVTIKPLHQTLSKKQKAHKADKENTNPRNTIDISNLSSGAKGNIVEDRIKELVLLYGQGMLNVYKPVIDNEGIDLIVLKNGQFHSLYLQVKSRYNAHESQKLVLTISKTFKAHHNYFIVGVSFNASKMEVEDKILFIPSKVVEENATRLPDNKLRINASLKEGSKDIWQAYLMTKEKMIEKLLDKFAIMEEHLK